MKISVVIITFNEEKNIARCINSVKEIADEIIVVDSFSTDTTCKIAEELGAKIIPHKFDGHIQQKNYAKNLAENDFVLSLDADELLDNQLINSILQIKNNGPSDGYTMNRLTNYCGKWIRHSGWYPDTKLRLWNHKKGNWGGVNPHDEFFLEKNSSIQHLNGNILHYSYYTIADHDKQIEYFTNIASLAALEKGKKSTVLKIVFSPILKFLKMYFLQLGFLDGYFGFIIARKSAYAAYLKYKKIKNLQARL
jgi:glycosyltransferase involved in cell wall biosynthesis